MRVCQLCNGTGKALFNVSADPDGTDLEENFCTCEVGADLESLTEVMERIVNEFHERYLEELGFNR